MTAKEAEETTTGGKRHWPLVGLVAVELLVTRLLLFSLGHRTTARVLGVVTPPPRWVVGEDPDPKAVAETVETVAGRLPIWTTCLVQALACEALLDRSGVETDLRIGVAKADGDLEAHAWLVHRGEVLVGGTHEDPDRFRKLADRFEP